MANYSYIRGLPRRLSVEEFEQRLVEAVDACFGERMRVERADWEDDGPTWIVISPGFFYPDGFGGPDPEEFGFPVTLETSGRVISFRHSINSCQDWAQGCIAEYLSIELDKGVYYDATGRTYTPDECWHLKAGSFWEYYAGGLPRPLSEEDIQWLRPRYEVFCPKGWEPLPEALKTCP